jgi:HK97 family phage prohead protease
MLKRYGKAISSMGPRFAKSDSLKPEPAFAIEGWALITDEPIGLQTGEIVVFEPGCLDKSLASRKIDFRLAHDETEVVGSTNSGLELYVADQGIAYRMPLTNKRYATTIKRKVESKSQSAISVGVKFVKTRDQVVGKHNVVFVQEADLIELSLVAEGCCTQAYASLIDANESPSLKDSINTPLFKLESMTHNVRVQGNKNRRRLLALSDRLAVLQTGTRYDEPHLVAMTSDQCNRLMTERYERLQSDARARLGL